MAVKIIIKRVVTEDNIKYLTALLKQLRTLANNQPGYISGETLRNFENPNDDPKFKKKLIYFSEKRQNTKYIITGKIAQRKTAN